MKAGGWATHGGFLLVGLLLAGAAHGEGGEQYPENRVHGAVYRYSFGASKQTGPRARVFPFREPRLLGTVLFAHGDRLTVAAQSPDGVWHALRRRDAEGALTEAAFSGKGVSFWEAPTGLVATAVRATVTVPPEATPQADGLYHAEVGGLHVWSNRWENVAPFATAFASSGLRGACAVLDGDVSTWKSWANESNGRPISPENAPFIGLAWPRPVEVASLALAHCYFSAADVQAHVGAGHPLNGSESDWKTIKSLVGCRSWYPTRSNLTLVDLDAPVTTRALRLRIVAPADGRLDSHPHVRNLSKGGCRAELREFMALATPAAAATARAVAAEAKPREVGIPVSFDMPFDGVVTLVVERPDGRRVRNLVSAKPFRKGRHTVLWDGSDDLGRDVDAASHGLYSVPCRPVAPGTYRIRGLAHAPLRAFYEFPVYAAGDPPWGLPDHTGGWLANHSAPRAAAFLPPDRLAFGANVTEGPDGVAICDLDGRKVGGRGWIGGVWTVAAFLAADVGRTPVRERDYYAGGLHWGDEKAGLPPVLRLTAVRKDGREDRFGGFPLAPGTPLDDQVGGLAVRDGTLAFSLTRQNRIVVTNPVTKAVWSVSVPSPRGLAYETDGSLLVLSSNALVRVAADLSGVSERLLTGLDEPVGLAVREGTACVSCRGDSHQVWVLALGKGQATLVRKIGRAGRPRSGAYDACHMNNPAGLCLDARGRLWVTEQDFLPKRVSCWNLADGRLEKAVYGPAKYGAGGMFDPHDRTRFYYSEGGGLMEFAVDWAAGTSRLARVLLRPEERGDDRRAPPERVIRLPGGRRLYTNCWNADPVSGRGAGLWKEEGDRLVPLTGLEAPGIGGVTFADDGTVYVQRLPAARAPDERQARKAGGPSDAVRFRPVGHDAEGFPVYDFTKPERLFANARPSGSTGGNQIVVDAKGNAFLTAPAGDSPSHSICGGRDGVITWSYPNMWPGLHAGHSAPRNAPKGRLTAVTRLLGDAVPVAGTDETVVAVNGNHGEIYVFTTDGFFVDNVFENCETGRRWAFGNLPRGSELTGVSPGDEHFWPTLNRLPDGTLCLVAGKDVSCVVRLGGLETLRRLPDGAVTVTAEALRDVQAAREAEARRRREVQGVGTLVCALGEAPEVDGDLGDWDPAGFMSIESRGVAAYFDSTSKPYDIRGALKATKTHLYAAWKCGGAPSLAFNTGEVPELQFKTGGAVDLMLRTDPKASGRGPQPGDLRLLASLVKGGKDGASRVPRVMLYEQRARAGVAVSRVPFTSPVMTVAFDRVIDVTDACRFAQGKTGDCELEVPLSLLGFVPAPGLETRGDIGVLRGADGATVARLYWANKATALVSDVPSEAKLSPEAWGRVLVRER